MPKAATQNAAKNSKLLYFGRPHSRYSVCIAISEGIINVMLLTKLSD